MVNQIFDSIVQPMVPVFGNPKSAFQLSGIIGLLLAILLSSFLVVSTGLSLLVLVAVIIAAVSTFFVLAALTKVFTGKEVLVYYHHEIAILLVVTALLWLLKQPVLAYVDITILGVGAFLFSGRMGCLMVGCCHGRPNRIGVCYRPEHADEGFSSYLVGVRLFPIQAIESLWVLFIVIIGGLIVLDGSAPGLSLAWYIVAYDLGRFSFEFMRGGYLPFTGSSLIGQKIRER